MTDEELIARLRVNDPMCEEHFTANLAANRIEALVKQCEGLAQAAMNNGQALILAEARAERLEEALRDILEKPRNADLTYAELFAEVVSEARAALKGADHE